MTPGAKGVGAARNEAARSSNPPASAGDGLDAGAGYSGPVEASQRKPATRMIALGSAALVEGFGLLGFETYPNADVRRLDTVLTELGLAKTPALVVLEDYLARCESPELRRVRDEDPRVVVVEIPGLNVAGDYQPQVERLVRSVLGPAALD